MYGWLDGGCVNGLRAKWEDRWMGVLMGAEMNSGKLDKRVNR